MKKIIVCVAALIMSLHISAQNGTTNQNMSNPNSSTNTVVPGGGILNEDNTLQQNNSLQQDNTLQQDKTLVNQAPVEISTRFTQDNPGITNINWNQEGKNYRATYTDPTTNLEHIVVYDADGNVVRRESMMDNMSSPSGISNYYSKNYPNESFQVWQNDDGTSKSYYTNHNGDMLWFDEYGNYQGNRQSNNATQSPKSFNTQQNGSGSKSGAADYTKSQGGNKGKGVSNEKSGTKKMGNPYESSGSKSKGQVEKKNTSKKQTGSSNSGTINSDESDYDKSIPQPQHTDSTGLIKERKPMSGVKDNDDDSKDNLDNFHQPKK